MILNRILLILLSVLMASCHNAVSQKENLLNVEAFQQKLAQTRDAQLVDVRTAEEFNAGHLKSALNMDINNNDLAKRSQYLDKEKPLFVYCYSGGRSARACDYLRKAGFKIVYDMDGGINKWREKNLPEEKPSTVEAGMSKEDFDKIISSNKKVVVDVNAKWCAPCLKMKPDLTKLTNDYKDKVFFLDIDKDKNRQLAKELGVTEIPVFLIYKEGKLVMTTEGYRDFNALRELFEM